MAKKVEAIRKSIKAVATSAKNLGQRVHGVAVDCLEHYQAHGDTSLCSELINSLKGSGIYRKALLEWFKKHGGMEVKKGNEAGLIFVKRKDFNNATVKMAEAKADFFGKKDTDADATKPTLDVFKMLAKVLEKDQLAHDAPETYKEIKTTLNENQRKVLEQLIAAGAAQADQNKGMLIN